jgi:hypothetical protein
MDILSEMKFYSGLIEKEDYLAEEYLIESMQDKMDGLAIKFRKLASNAPSKSSKEHLMFTSSRFEKLGIMMRAAVRARQEAVDEIKKESDIQKKIAKGIPNKVERIGAKEDIKVGKKSAKVEAVQRAKEKLRKYTRIAKTLIKENKRLFKMGNPLKAFGSVAALTLALGTMFGGQALREYEAHKDPELANELKAVTFFIQQDLVKDVQNWENAVEKDAPAEEQWEDMVRQVGRGLQVAGAAAAGAMALSGLGRGVGTGIQRARTGLKGKERKIEGGARIGKRKKARRLEKQRRRRELESRESESRSPNPTRGISVKYEPPKQLPGSSKSEEM